MRKTILDLKMKVITSEPEGVYITPADSKYTIPELKERMVTVVEEQQYAVLRFLSLVSDFKVGDEKQYIGQIIDLNKIPNLGESMIIAAPTGSGKTKAITNMIHKATTFYKRLKEAFIMTNSTPNFTGRNVPIKEIAKATGKDPQFIRIGIQRGIFNFGYAFKRDGSSEYNYLCPDKKVWEELGYFKDVSNNT